MQKPSPAERVAELRARVEDANHRYYVLDDPSIPDADYDALLRELEALDAYSAAVGLAFQVVDDVLDATADSATLGKTAGKDAADNKPTYVSILGLEPSRALAEQLRRDAHEALAPFGDKAQRLRELADLIVQRKA